MQLNIFDWIDETMAKISELIADNCRWINAAIDEASAGYADKEKLCQGIAQDQDAERIIFTAAKMRDEYCKRLHKKKQPLIWNGEIIEA